MASVDITVASWKWIFSEVMKLVLSSAMGAITWCRGTFSGCDVLVIDSYIYVYISIQKTNLRTLQCYLCFNNPCPLTQPTHTPLHPYTANTSQNANYATRTNQTKHAKWQTLYINAPPKRTLKDRQTDKHLWNALYFRDWHACISISIPPLLFSLEGIINTRHH